MNQALATTSYTPILPLHIDSTMMSCFRSCPQKFFLEYILGLRPGKTSIDLHFGAVFSSCLEHLYRMVWERSVDPRTALDRTLIFFEKAWGDRVPDKESSPKTKANCWEALETYITTYPPLSDHVQPLIRGGRSSFEFSFAIPLDDPSFPRHPSGDPFIYVGRADLLGEHRARPCLRDEKTSSRLDSNWSSHWNLRSQFLGYLWAARRGGLPSIDTVVVRGIIVYKARSPAHVEAIKVYPDHLIDLWYEQLKRDLWRLCMMWDGFQGRNKLRRADHTAFDYNLGETCTAYGLCSYMDVCQSTKPASWYSNFEVVRWNPLNRNPIEGNGTETSSAATPHPVLGG